MIELNSKTQQDFLNREWVQRLLDAGVDMSDAKYCIVNWGLGDGTDFIKLKSSVEYLLKTESTNPTNLRNIVPTYTVSELLYKLHEWIYPIIDGKEYSGGLRMLKDAPFYIFYYQLHAKDDDRNHLEDYIYAEFEYPIESLASLLIQCHTKDIGLKMKDTGNISDK